MNSKPRRSSFGPGDRLALLESMGEARDWITRLCAAVSPSSDRYRRCSAVLRALDDLAGDLTGDRTYYHSKPHGGSR
jgi:hypothetical protein